MFGIIPRYLIINYFKYFGYVLGVIFFVLYLIDFSEFMRKYSALDIRLWAMLKIVFYKSNDHLYKTIPFAFFIAALLYIMRLNLDNELVILRSANAMPIYKILGILSLGAFCFGVLYILAFNPLNANMLKRYEIFEAKHMKGKPSTFMLSNTGLWFREESANNKVNIINTMRIAQNTKQAFDVEIYTYDKNLKRVENISASRVDVLPNKWILHDAEVLDENFNLHKYAQLERAISIDFLRLKNSIANPDTISLWEMPGFIRISRNSGLPTIMHEIQFFSLLLMPLYFAVMVSFGGVFAFSSSRHGTLYRNIVWGLATGFFVYFISDVVKALGIVTRLPVLLIALLPIIIIAVVTIYLMIVFEEKSI